MNTIHSVTTNYVSIKDLIVSFSSPLHGTAQAARWICHVSNSMYSNKFSQFEFECLLQEFRNIQGATLDIQCYMDKLRIIISWSSINL